MNESTKTTPKDFFLWLGAISALYMSAVSLLMLFFEYIDKLFADPLETYVDPFSGQIRFAIASLVIIFPLYIYLTRKLNKDIRLNPFKEDIWVRRWLIYFTLFAAGLTIVVDLIVLINTFLGGEELTTAFLLKVVSILIVIGGAFYYYLQDIKGRWKTNEKLSKTIGGVVALVVAASVVGGFFIMGSPQEQRALRFDQDRIYDLQQIQSNITTYYQQKGELPEALEDVEDPLFGFYIPTDPETETAYGYTKTGELTFELCATFALENKNAKELNVRSPYGYDSASWDHEAGNVCFERTIDPDKFPLIRDGLTY